MSEKPTYLTTKEFLDSGLLFLINWAVLHPLGMAIEVSVDKDKDGKDVFTFGGVWDYRDDPEKMLFGDDLMQAGSKKLNAYAIKRGCADVAERVATMQHVHQALADCDDLAAANSMLQQLLGIDLKPPGATTNG